MAGPSACSAHGPRPEGHSSRGAHRVLSLTEPALVSAPSHTGPLVSVVRIATSGPTAQTPPESAASAWQRSRAISDGWSSCLCRLSTRGATRRSRLMGGQKRSLPTPLQRDARIDQRVGPMQSAAVEPAASRTHRPRWSLHARSLRADPPHRPGSRVCCEHRAAPLSMAGTPAGSAHEA